MPNETVTTETGPKGVRCVVRLSWVNQRPYARPRTWKSAWFSSGNEQRDFYFARMAMQKRIADAIERGEIPR